MSEMHTIKEEPEDEAWDSDNEKVILRGKGRESLSTVQLKKSTRSLGKGWFEYVTPSGRYYYYNSETKEKSWKPPRKALEVEGKSLTQGDLSPDSYDQTFSGMVHSRFSLPEFPSTEVFGEDTKSGNIGKILRTGILKTMEIGINGEKVKKKWVKSIVVLTEFYILFTTVVGSFKKLFRKTKCPTPSRYYLGNAEVRKEMEASSRGNVYRLKTVYRDVLFRSKNPTAAESWYQALTLVITNLNKSENALSHENLNLHEIDGRDSFDLGEALTKRETLPFLANKSVSMSNFEFGDTSGEGPKKCLSDFFGVKYPAPPGWISIFDSETKQFCYVNCITQKKWFWAMTEDGHPYFYEEGFGRRSWLLPSIYLDVNSETLKEIRRSIGSRKSVKDD